eukprot:m.150745 g.150745  ORF g.150745 m.150745 type:complete len:850 (-) comp16887_c0_seq2:211-2760(-)
MADLESEELEDGTVITRMPDGLVVEARPDGSTLAVRPDGLSVLSLPDKTQIVTQVDGIIIETRVDGTKIVTQTDGVVVETRPSGHRLIRRPDGMVIQENPDGTKVVLQQGARAAGAPAASTSAPSPATAGSSSAQPPLPPRGPAAAAAAPPPVVPDDDEDDSVEVVDATDDVITEIQPDGTKVTMHPDYIEVTQLDGTVVRTTNDGRQTVTRPDGVVVEIGADGSHTVVSKGKNRQEHAAADPADAKRLGKYIKLNFDQENHPVQDEHLRAPPVPETRRPPPPVSDDEPSAAEAISSEDETPPIPDKGRGASVASTESLEQHQPARAAPPVPSTRPVSKPPTMPYSASTPALAAPAPPARPISVSARPSAMSLASAPAADSPAGSPPRPPLAKAIVREGWLMKEGGSVKSWKKRYFVLSSDARIDYYEKPLGKFINSIILQGAQVTLPSGAKRPFTFHVFTLSPEAGQQNKRSKYVLCAHDETDRTNWVEAIRKVSSEGHSSAATPIVPLMQASAAAERARSVVFPTNFSVPSTSGLRQTLGSKMPRFQDDDFDLDLTYVTNRVIAMAGPEMQAPPGRAFNRLFELQRFLDNRHSRRYKVFNLCTECSYSTEEFKNRVAWYPFADRSVPLIDQLRTFCLDVDQWLKQHPENIAAVHCDDGRGRTGTMVASFLLHSKTSPSAREAITAFNDVRTSDGKGLTVASQLRYVSYYELVISRGLPAVVTKCLSKISLKTMPRFEPKGGCNPYFLIYCNNELVYNSKPASGPVSFYKNMDVSFMPSATVEGDVRLEMHDSEASGEDEEVFRIWFNPAFIAGEQVRFGLKDLDLKPSPSRQRSIDPEIAVEITFEA